MGYTLHISPKEINKQATAIFRPVKFGENGIGICYPGCFISYTIRAFTDSPSILKKYLGSHFHKYLFIPIDLSPDDTIQTVRRKAAECASPDDRNITHTETLLKLSKSVVASGKDPYFFLMNIHLLTQKTQTKILDELYGVITNVPRAGSIIFTEANIDESQTAEHLSRYHRFFQNRLWFPVYSQRESISFVETLSRTWNMHLSKKMTDDIVAACGGYLWLLREAVRFLRDNKNASMETVVAGSQINQRVKYICNLLDKRTVDTLARVCLDQDTHVPVDVLRFITSTGLVVSDKGTYHLSCPLFTKFVSAQRNTASINLGADGTIYCKDESIQRLFGSTEAKIITQLLSERGKLVSREQIAKTLWGNEYADKYSDWAIDKAISRIRKILVSVGLPKTAIVTKKKFGFYLN